MDLAEVLTANRQVKLDRALLTADQLKEYDRWQEFFHGPIWRDLVRRYEPRIDALQASYHRVQGEQNLGYVQGSLNTLYDVFLNLPDLVHLEFLLQTGQITENEGPSDEDPVAHGKWDS